MPRPAESTLDLDTPSNPEVTDSGVVEPVRLVTSDFTNTSTTSVGPTKIGALGDVVAHNVGVLADHELVAEPVVLQGGSGMDLLVGGPGHDQLFGNQGDDTLVGQGGNDMLDGGEDADWLLGGAGDDHLIGGFGNDTLEGGAGNDRLEGGHDDDILKGGEGDDVLVGGSGRDVMIGGAGRDTFVAQPGFHYGGLDTVTDFQTGDGQPHWAVRDRIDLSAALDGSTFAGTTAAEAFAQGYIYFVQHGNPGEEGFGTTVRLDRNGSAENYGYHNDVALIDLQGVAADELRLSSGYYGPGNFIV